MHVREADATNVLVLIVLALLQLTQASDIRRLLNIVH